VVTGFIAALGTVAACNARVTQLGGSSEQPGGTDASPVDASARSEGTGTGDTAKDATSAPSVSPPPPANTAAEPGSDAASACEPLSCQSASECASFAWPGPTRCDPQALGHGFTGPIVIIGCGFIVIESDADVGQYEQSIYDESTGALLGTRQSFLGKFTCSDSRPDVRRTTNPFTHWTPDCPTVRTCFTCSLPTVGGPYMCRAADGSFYPWSPPDAGF
jgi:hypothetical protein